MWIMVKHSGEGEDTQDISVVGILMFLSYKYYTNLHIKKTLQSVHLGFFLQFILYVFRQKFTNCQ
jgi:hypothetical protein